jgi:DoxX-like family
MKRILHGTGTVLITLGGLLLLGSAAAKLAHVPKVVAQMASLGFDGHKLTLVGLLEVASAVLFLVPYTRSIGLLLVSSFMGAVIAVHMGHDQSIVAPSIILLLVWLGAVVRHREVMWSVQPIAGATVRAAIAEERR